MADRNCWKWSFPRAQRAEEAAGDASQGQVGPTLVQYLKGLDVACQTWCPPQETGRTASWPPSFFTPQSLLFLEAEISAVLGPAIKHTQPQAHNEPGRLEEKAKPVGWTSTYMVRQNG